VSSLPLRELEDEGEDDANMTKVRVLLLGVLAVLVLVGSAAGCGLVSDKTKQEAKKKVESKAQQAKQEAKKKIAAKEHPAVHAGAGALEAGVVRLYAVVIVVVGVYPSGVHSLWSFLWAGLRGVRPPAGPSLYPTP
jgi:hypothetical protein